MSPASEKIILALDVATLEEAEGFVKTLSPAIGIFKVGKQLFTRCGPSIIEMIHHHGGKVFLDLKYHDIPNTVARAVEEATKLKVFMLTIHAMGGFRMMQEAIASSISNSRNSSTPPPIIVAVTILTSLKQKDLTAIGMDLPIEEAVSRLAALAKQAGVNGVVASAQEAQRIKAACGDGFIIVTPGIRPKDSSLDDQKRVVTPKDAFRAGSTFMVIGRPILKADDPLKAAEAIVQEIGEA
jgi:orotidine-5'-phosphate decarboxylase